MSKQHTTPCRECPFRRGGLPGWLGGSSAETFIGQAHGNFWLPCHLHSKYDDPNWKNDTTKPQCAGAAIYRANVFKSVPPSLLTLPKNGEIVFATPAEFLAFHKRITVEAAAAELRKKNVTQHMIEEYNRIADGEGFVQVTLK